MNTSPSTQTLAMATPRRSRGSIWRRSVAFSVLRRPLALAATIVLVAIIVACVGASLWSPYDPLKNDLAASLSGPTAEHWLGTDQLGRDVLSRLLHGGQPALLAALQVLLAALVVAIPVGIISGYVGGKIDGILMRIVDIGMSIPNMIVILLVLSVFSDNLQLAYFVLGFLLVPAITRVIRSGAIAVRDELYIDAAKVSGVSSLRIVFEHVMPRVMGIILVQATLVSSIAILVTGGLAYLGFGVQPPYPSWGSLIGEAMTVLNKNPWLLIASGGIMGITVICLGIVGDSIRDATVEKWSGRVEAAKPQRKQGTPLPTQPVEGNPHALLSVRNLEISFRRQNQDVVVAHDVSFDVGAGEVLGIVGESGCGKTSVSRAILGLLRGTGRVTAGQILFDGQDLTTLTADEMRALRGTGIAFVSQEPMVALDPTQRVGNLVMASIRLHTGASRAEAKARMLELFRLVRLDEPERVARLYPHEISGGMAQRVSIARALTGDPRLLIADEPTTALDVTVQAEILDLLRSIRERTGMAIIIVTHDWGVVSDICDKAIVMYAGQIVEEAPLARMFSRPLHPYTSGLLTSNPSLVVDDADRLPTIPGTIPTPENWPASCHFADRCPLVTAACRAQPIPLVSVADERFSRCIRVDELVAASTSDQEDR